MAHPQEGAAATQCGCCRFGDQPSRRALMFSALNTIARDHGGSRGFPAHDQSAAGPQAVRALRRDDSYTHSEQSANDQKAADDLRKVSHCILLNAAPKPSHKIAPMPRRATRSRNKTMQVHTAIGSLEPSELGAPLLSRDIWKAHQNPKPPQMGRAGLERAVGAKTSSV